MTLQTLPLLHMRYPAPPHPANQAPQIELKLRYKFRLILDESWSFGVLGRTGRGLTEHQNVDAAEVDMIVGSLAGPLCAGGGFCAGSDEIVEHQRISSAAYTFSAALPAMLATTASETLALLQTTPDLLAQARENVRSLWAQLDPRSDWVCCTSAAENPMMLLVLKPEVVAQRRWGVREQEGVVQDVVDEVGAFDCAVLEISSSVRGVVWLIRDFLPVLVSRPGRPRHPRQEHPTGQLGEGRGVGAAAGAEGVRYDGAVAEGDRAGGHHDPACGYEGREGKEVIVSSGLWTGGPVVYRCLACHTSAEGFRGVYA